MDARERVHRGISKFQSAQSGWIGGNGPFGTSKRWYLIYTEQSHHFKRLSIYFLLAFILLEHEMPGLPMK